MKCSAQVLRSIFFSAWAVIGTVHCMANPSSPDVESLIRDNRWKEASRVIFLAARSTNKFELTIPLGQAKAGLLDDALETIAGMPPTTQPGALLSLAVDVPAISPKQKMELVQRAIDASRNVSGRFSNYFKSGALTRISLFYSRNGAESEAHALFEEALRAAASGAAEEGSGGYREITNALVRESKDSQEWMILLVAKHLQQEGNSTNSAFAYKDLAEVAVRLHKNELASALIQSGISAAKSINKISMQKSALEGLSSVAMEAGYTMRLPEKPPYALAIQEARSGNPQNSRAIAAGLSRNLYVDHGQAAFENVFNDAVTRNDLNTAIYVAEHPIRPVSWVQANAWRQIAELQARNGAQKEAASSYLRAAQAISNSQEATRYFEQVKAMVALGASMHQNGLGIEGRKATLDAAAMIDLIPERRADDRIKAGTLVSEALWHYGIYSEAKQQILRAYRAAVSYSDKNPREKARLLSGIGEAISTFIPKASH